MRLAQVASDPLRVAVEHLRDAPYDAADDQLRAITLEIVATLKVENPILNPEKPNT